MLDELEPNIRLTVIGILSELYMSGLVDKVDISNVMRLFGISKTSCDKMSGEFLYFNDPEVIAAIESHLGVDLSEDELAEKYKGKSDAEKLDIIDNELDMQEAKAQKYLH